MINPKDGQWVVVERHLGGYFDVHRVIRSTPSTMVYLRGGKEWRMGKSCIVYAGTEEQARLCASHLASGQARFDEECRAASERWRERKANILKADSLT